MRVKLISLVRLLNLVIARVEQRNPSVKAWVFQADEARDVEQTFVSGAELGPLHGVPTAIKDLFDFKPG